MPTDKIKITLRPAEKKDLINVFELANDELVRKNSFQSDKIKLGDHKKWFENKLEDKNSLILIASSGSRFAGQIRFDFDKENIIGVSVAAGFRGQGLGAVLVRNGLNYVKENRPDVMQIIAYVKKDNPASIKIFEHNHFVLKKEVKIKDSSAYKYIYNTGEEVNGI